jgi:hypothetical protein
MAKRVSPEEKPWNPVEAQLAHDVLRPKAPTNINIADPPAPSSPRVVSIDAHREQAKPELEGEPKEEAKEAEKLCREKRVLLTESEEDTLETLVKSMGKKLGTPVKLSHVLRATISLLMHSQDELIKQSEKMGRLKRPPNNDPVALATFEHNLARILDRSIRGSRIME